MQGLPYQVFLTCNSEYHLQSHVCVGVRDRRTGRWLEEHPALSRPLSASVCTAGQRALLQAPQLGESLEFDLGGEPLRTSPVLNIEQRPSRAFPPAVARARTSSNSNGAPRTAPPPRVTVDDEREESRVMRRARWSGWPKWARSSKAQSA